MIYNFQFFYLMDPVIIYTMVFPSVCSLLDSQIFSKDLYFIEKEDKKPKFNEDFEKTNEAHYLYSMIMVK